MKVLLIDDHPLILMALAQVLTALDPELETVAATLPEQAYAALANDPEISLVLLDLNLGEGLDGFGVLARLRQDYPSLSVTVVSGTERLADVVRVVDMGAMGFVPKRSTPAELNHGLAMVTSGGVYIPPALLELITRLQGKDLGDTTIGAAAAQLAASDAAAAAGLLPGLADGPAPANGAAPALPVAPPLAAPNLTPRQTDVLGLLLKGLSNKLIARELNLSVETVKDHVAAVLRALGVSSRMQAVLAVSRLNQRAAGPVAGGAPPATPGA